MNAPAAFQASFADVKFIKSRSVAVLCFEIPIEGADAALAALGGVPKPGGSVWVGIARIDLTKAASEPVKPESKPSDRERRRFDTLKGAEQAGIMCETPAFQRFLGERNGMDFDSMSSTLAAAFVRNHCGIESRSEIKHGTPAGDKWSALERAYSAWKST